MHYFWIGHDYPFDYDYLERNKKMTAEELARRLLEPTEETSGTTDKKEARNASSRSRSNRRTAGSAQLSFLSDN